MKKHPAVQDAIVVGVPDEKFGEAITAVVSFRPGESATPDEIVATVKANLSAFKAPRHVVVVGEVARGPERQGRLRRAKRIAAEHVA